MGGQGPIHHMRKSGNGKKKTPDKTVAYSTVLRDATHSLLWPLASVERRQLGVSCACQADEAPTLILRVTMHPGDWGMLCKQNTVSEIPRWGRWESEGESKSEVVRSIRGRKRRKERGLDVLLCSAARLNQCFPLLHSCHVAVPAPAKRRRRHREWLVC